MTLSEVCETLFLYICRVNRTSRKTGKGDYRQTRAEIESLFTDANTRVASDPLLAAQFREVKLALVFFVDSMIAESDLPFAAEWHANRLAFELDKLGWAEKPEMAGDEKFFDILEETIADKSDAATERLAILYTCLGLGFTGWYTGQPEYLKSKMLELAVRLRQSMDAQETTRICPQAYEHVDRGVLYMRPVSKLGGIALALGIFLLVVFAINLAAYNAATSEMEGALDAIRSLNEDADASD